MNRTALALAVLLACALARRVPSPRQRTIATTLAGLLALDVCRPMLPWLTLRVAVFVTWYAATAWSVWAVLAKEESPGVPARGLRHLRDLRSRSRQILAVSALLVSSVFVGRFGMTMFFERAAFALALAAQVLAALRFFSRGHSPDDAQRVALILVASSVVDALPGPWLLGEPSRDWNVGRWIAVATWLVIAGWETVCLIRVRVPRA